MKHLVTDPQALVGKKVRVYRNLRNKCWSVQLAGRVVAHTQHLELKDVSFVVYESGYRRFLREGRKNVHAFICGELVSINNSELTNHGMDVRYNPQVAKLFFTVAKVFKGREYFFSELDVLTHGYCSDKRVWVSNEEE